LAGKIGVNPAVLKATVDEYNGFCEKGHDDLFAKNPKYLRPVKQPKFYAFRIVNMAYGTVGGIKINERTEVLNTQDDVIPGLYAVGDCANGALSYDFSLAFRLRGNPASFAWNTGRIAGENVLKYIGK
jgi:fumarate reductase flavoprotein subunit